MKNGTDVSAGEARAPVRGEAQGAVQVPSGGQAHFKVERSLPLPCFSLVFALLPPPVTPFAFVSLLFWQPPSLLFSFHPFLPRLCPVSSPCNFLCLSLSLVLVAPISSFLLSTVGVVCVFSAVGVEEKNGLPAPPHNAYP